MDMLQWRRPYIVLSPNYCYLCRKNSEFANHIFIHCKFTLHREDMEIFSYGSLIGFHDA